VIDLCWLGDAGALFLSQVSAVGLEKFSVRGDGLTRIVGGLTVAAGGVEVRARGVVLCFVRGV
jgi:hypothetical protein